MEDTLFGKPIKYVEREGPPPVAIFGPPPYFPPFDKCATIVIHGQDFEHAEWIGEPYLPVPFSYQMLFCIERLPWKLLEVKDEPDYAIRWFKRAHSCPFQEDVHENHEYQCVCDAQQTQECLDSI